jgi:dTDP-glucose 4,6-dehydratase
MTRRYLITGGAGFIGSNFVRYLLEKEPDARVTNLDLLTYAGVKATIQELDTFSNHQFIQGDIRDYELVDRLMADHDVVVHFAAESHVDRSVSGPSVFLETNVVGTGVLIDAAMRHGVDRFLHVSTDEVYGSIAEGYASEAAPLAPSSPYSASKAASDLVIRSYRVTHGYGAITTRCTNNYGPYQFPEKVIPLFVTNLIEGKRVPLYGSGANERDWLFVRDHCAAIELLLEQGEPGETYNIGANAQTANVDLARRILAVFGRDESWIEYVTDRPGHDLRYAVDSAKIRALGWSPEHSLDEWLERTIDWYQTRGDWWRPLRDVRR